jgi:hypothetical protein
MQLNYAQNMPIAFNGMLADNGPRDVVTGTCEVVAGVPFGVGVVQGTNDDGFVLPNALVTQIKGITVHEHNDNRALAGNIAVAQRGSASLLRKGRCYVLPEQNVVAGDPVFLRNLVNGLLTPGNFRMDADGGNAVLVPNARWATTGLANTPAVVEINLP